MSSTQPPSRSRTRVVVALALLVAAATWVLVNGPVEGPVLLTITRNHGLTVADLPALAAGMVALVLLWRSSSQ